MVFLCVPQEVTMAEEERGFVIRDRRGRGAESETKPTESAEPASTLKSETAPDPHGKAVPPMNFLTFVYSLGTSALMLLGENPNAGASATAPNLGHAQEIIDILTMVILTVYFSDQTQPTPFVPSNILVLALLNVDIILLVVLLLLLSRNLVKAYFERRQRLLGSGFRNKLIAAFVGFTLIPSVLLVGLAGGLLSKSIDNWFGQEVEHALKDSEDVALAHRRGHETVALNSARAISREIYADGLLATEHQETLVLTMQRKRMEYGV